LTVLLDNDILYDETETINGPELQYTVNFSTTGVYYLWLRGYAPNAAGDSLYFSLDHYSPSITTTVTGFAPRDWSWANKSTLDNVTTIEITEPGQHTIHLWQREDGLRLDRFLLTTDGNYVPVGNGPAESERSNSN
jgi:hypothetical protein